MKYRSDIDGLRAIAVIAVILFHSGIDTFSGGYVGVDIFFVISGYLITTLIYDEVIENRFTFASFYKRRAARLLPALSITILLVLIFGFVFYSTKPFDNLGKEIFFSSLGAANILFAQGINYFAKDEAYQPLIHLWSLGVEEQFYILWPAILLLTYRIEKKFVLPVTFLLFIVSLYISTLAVEAGQTKAYFLLHYRAFELLVGVLVALVLIKITQPLVSERLREMLSITGLTLILLPIFLFDKNTDFPGINALLPCIGAALIISFRTKGPVSRILSHKLFVVIGLISYPLYLLHQPLISFIHFFELELAPITVFILVTLVAAALSWLIYHYVETPIRRYAHQENGNKSLFLMSTLISLIPLFAVAGIIVSKSNGLEARFKYLNPFAMEVSKAHSTTFHEVFERGYKVSSGEHGKVLFIGDSVLQQYVLPMKNALDLELEEIDSVTRGGCVLLKNVDFKDKFSDISCDEIRESLYHSTKTYDYIVISQAWNAYGDSVTNFPEGVSDYQKWLPFLQSSIEHFSKLTNNIIIIGEHLLVDGTIKLQPSITTDKRTFASQLNDVVVNNLDELNANYDFFQKYNDEINIQVIHPYEIFCHRACITNDGEWSYFSDNQHVSSAATNFIVQRLRVLLDN